MRQRLRYKYYNRVGLGLGLGLGLGTMRRNGSRGGLRLNLKRFSVSRLRARIMSLFRVLSTWRRFLFTLKLKTKTSQPKSQSQSQSQSQRYSYSYSNSFYAEAIADCLEFIKRSSISDSVQIHHHNQLLHPYP